jgi:alkylhydroperoxidase/carboxymuconolactone decarboxylase family protein YurZ
VVDDAAAETMAGFWERTRPGVLEGYLAQEAQARLPGGEGVGELALALMWLHHHAIVGFEDGLRAEAGRAHALGATKDQLLELLALAFIHSGPRGMRLVAQVCGEMIAGYQPVERDGRAFPHGWEPDPEALRSGLDFSDPELSAAEMERLRAWYGRYLGESPPYVEFLWAYRPALLKVYRNRLEHAVRTALPKQIVPFVLLHYEAVRGSGPGVREQLLLCRGFGVTRDQALEAVSAALLYSGPAAVATVETAAGDVLREWPA